VPAVRKSKSQTRAASLVDRAYASIKQRILGNDMPPGFQVLEQELALQHGMSRTPVREALIRLQTEGLVELIRRHGMRVLPVSPDDMREIYDILTALEAQAAYLVTLRRPNEAVLEGLEASVVRMERAMDVDDRLRWAEADESFHRLLLDECGNSRLAATAHMFWDQSHRARLLTLKLRPKPERSTREHRAVVAAMRSGNEDAARESMRAHRQYGAEVMVKVLREYRLLHV